MDEAIREVVLLLLGVVVGLVIGYDLRRAHEEIADRRKMYRRVKEGALRRLDETGEDSWKLRH